MSEGIDFSDYTELVGEGGYEAKSQTDPKNDFFHAIYISGQSRQNSVGEQEIPGKLQIRGVRSNMDSIYMVITHIKEVLVKSAKVNNRETTECFSYKAGNPPWKSTTNRVCGMNSGERQANEFCNKCRSQIIVSGFLIDENTGKPFMVDEKEVYVFIRAKGVKYGAIAEYLSSLARRDDLEPIVTPVTEESRKFEKAQVNHKRFITVISVGKESTSFGIKDVFKLETGSPLSANSVKSTLNRAKETMEKFKEKFDWSRNKSGQANFSGTSNTVEDSQKFDFNPTSSQNTKTSQPTSQPKKIDNFSFEDVDF